MRNKGSFFFSRDKNIYVKSKYIGLRAAKRKSRSVARGKPENALNRIKAK